MAGKRLTGYTTVTNTDTGDSETFPPGTEESDLPDWAKDRIDNPKVWLEPGDVEAEEGGGEQHTGEYADKTVQQLVEEARDRGITGLSNANKSDLIAALEADDASNSG